MFQTVGSVCSGIEAGSVAWDPLGFKFDWFSEIAPFPALLLKEKYPATKNLGDMNYIPGLLRDECISTPDIICGGTPCQAFSLAGLQSGLKDDRANLTLHFVDIVNANDQMREKKGLPPCIIFWENVEGVLSDKTNAFGCMVSSLAGFSEVIDMKTWPIAGLISGPTRNIAWRVLDAKYFGIPQQRKRLYVIAGGKDFAAENVLFEENHPQSIIFPKVPLCFDKDNHSFEIFREYTDCLYSAYGTKWNGNAAAYNGSLYVVQDDRIRRLSPLECERLMGLPDNYTKLKYAKPTNRYQAIGNSWAVPVIKWIGNRIKSQNSNGSHFIYSTISKTWFLKHLENGRLFYPNKGYGKNINQSHINASPIPEECIYSDMRDIISPVETDDIYISPVGCFGILRRKDERNIAINSRLEEIFIATSANMPKDEIEKRSRIQKRGRFSENLNNDNEINSPSYAKQLSIPLSP